ncbi:hypothetical protein [Pseudonocardia oroxyli]|nr:hypothetical protein [Pseudonocardia oroxyli]
MASSSTAASAGLEVPDGRLVAQLVGRARGSGLALTEEGGLLAWYCNSS